MTTSIIPRVLTRAAMEPPVRLFSKALLTITSHDVERRARWDISQRPAYLLGVLTAAKQALKQNVPEISVLEFGVAGGSGLLALQDEARAVEDATGVRIRVYGFDMGDGLPPLIGDHRDHPDEWQEGDYPMDEQSLRRKLQPRTTLILGNVEDTARSFFADHRPPPIGFVSFDLDLYSSTRDALRVFTSADSQMLWHVPLYFDDIGYLYAHKFAGELLAIDEFNQQNEQVKIDRWHDVKARRPFPDEAYLDRMFVAHDLAVMAAPLEKRDEQSLPLTETG